MTHKHLHSFFLDQKMTIWSVLYLVFFCVLSLGQLERVELQNLPAFYIHDLLLICFVGLHVLDKKWRVFSWKLLQRVSTIGWVGLAWVGAGLLFTAISHELPVYTVLFICRLSLYLLAIVSVAFDLRRKRILPVHLMTALLTFFFFILYFGLLQYIFVPDTRVLFFLGWDDHYYRLISTLFDPGFTGILFIVGYIFVQYLLSLSTRNHLKTFEKKLLYVLGFFLSAGVLLTYSRASYLAFLLSSVLLLCHYYWRKQRHSFFTQLIVIVVFVGVIPFLPAPAGEGVNLQRSSTVVARLESGEQQLQLLRNPITFILGRGIFVPVTDSSPTQYSNQPTHARLPDNWLMMFLIGTGTVGTGIFLYMIVKELYLSVSRAVFLGVGVAAVLLHGLFNASVVYPFLILVLGSWGALEASTLES